MRPRSAAARALAGALLGALLAGCGLPLEGGVRVPGPVAGEAQEPGAVQDLPPGPQPDDGPGAIVLGFLNAQSNADDDHAIARQFLHPEIRDSWSDDRVLVRSPSVDLTVDPADESRVVTRTDVLARISEDGAYTLESGRREEVYELRRDETGQLRLVTVPSGLRLTPAEAAGSFRPLDVHFLREGGPAGEPARLVPDRVFLSVDDDLADSLVRRLLAGPSTALTGAVTTAFPPGTELRSPVTSDDGVVTVDLTGPVREAPALARQQMSAQLVWTLRGAGQVFTSLRLLVDGRPLSVDGAAALQARDSWPEYDPLPTDDDDPLLFVRDGRLAVLDGGTPAGPAGDGRLPVSAAVAAPDGETVALLSRGPDVVRVGPLAGPYADVLSQGSVGSMSWGSGDVGLWVVVGGAVLLVGDPAKGGVVTPVPVTPPEAAGPLQSLKVSRDGARAAGIFGDGATRQVLVGKVERSADGVRRLTGFRPVARSLTDVADVAWESGTSLVVLGALGTANRLPVRVTVDGSELEPVRTLGLDGEPETVAAAPEEPLVVGSRLADRSVLFVDESGLFQPPVPGSVPAYPG